jgi:hypothetical protein
LTSDRLAHYCESNKSAVVDQGTSPVSMASMDGDWHACSPNRGCRSARLAAAKDALHVHGRSAAGGASPESRCKTRSSPCRAACSDLPIKWPSGLANTHPSMKKTPRMASLELRVGSLFESCPRVPVSTAFGRCAVEALAALQACVTSGGRSVLHRDYAASDLGNV